MSTGYCAYCGQSYDLVGGHVCTPTVATTGTAVAVEQVTSAARNTIADRLSTEEVDRIAERVERRLAERERAQGGRP